jgi:hypothetical protein
MAGQWKKFGEKLGKQAGGPIAADWAAMEQKIAQTPALQPSPLVGLFSKMVLALFSIALISGAIYWYSNSPDTETQQIISQELIKSDSSAVNGNSISSHMPLDENSINSDVSLPQKGDDTSEAESKAFGEKEISINKDQIVSSDSQKNKNSTITPKSKIIPSPLNSSELASAQQQQQQLDENALPWKNSIGLEEGNKTAGLTDESSVDQLPLDKEMDNQNLLDDIQKDYRDTAGLGNKTTEVLDDAEKVTTGLDTVNRSKEEIVDIDTLTTMGQNLTSADTSSTDDNLNASSNKEEEPLAPGEFINPATGFKLQSLNIGIGAASSFKGSSSFGLQAAIDFQWERENWFFLGGISISQDSRQLNYSSRQNEILIDSSWTLNIVSRQEPIITRLWVIDSLNAGHYELDTTFQTVIDSNFIQNIDTTQYQISYPKSKQIRFQYAELPILYGYQLQRGPWRYALAGGISLQQAIAINDEDYSRDEDFSFAIMLQPSVSYKLNQHWAVFTRLRLQQQVIQNRLFQTNQSPYSCQVGVSYHW